MALTLYKYNKSIFVFFQFFDLAPAPENSPSETPSLIPEQSGPPPPYDTVVSKDDLIIEPLLRALNLQSAPPSPMNVFNKQNATNQSNSTPIHECCCCTNTNENIEYIKKCKLCGKEIETKHSSLTRNVDYCDCTETDTSISSVNQIAIGYPISMRADTPTTTADDIEFEFIDDDNNNNNKRDFFSSTGTLVAPQQEFTSAIVEHESTVESVSYDYTSAAATTSMLNDFTNNNSNSTNLTNNPYSSQQFRQYQYKKDRVGNNLHQIAKLDKTGLPTYDTAIILAAVAAASRGSSPQLKKKNNNNNNSNI